MKSLTFGSALLAVMLSGCTSKPTVYVYAKYLNDSQVTAVKNTFEQSQKYRVEINDFDFPTDLTQNTLLYSLLIQDPANIDLAYDLAKNAGFPIQQTEALTQGNHWYTKDSVALFLFPEGEHAHGVIFKRDLANKYIGRECGESASLTLKQDATFSITTSGGQERAEHPKFGIWKYRQYPYLELKTTDSVHSNAYFEIKQFKGADKVSEIDYVKLVAVNSGLLPAGCSFIVGTRI